MKLRKWLENWDMSELKISAGFLEAKWAPQTADRDAAWEMYIELLTRVATQPLTPDDGDEATALTSVHDLFGTTREVIRRHGRDCVEFTKIAVVVLNQVVRPFTAKWHRLSLQHAFDDPDRRNEFRNDLEALRAKLITYTRMLADLADVEDLTQLESQEGNG
ncbi:MAG: hypothetical protein ACFCUG_08550 [Thiotrichales bacterium]